MVTKEQKQVGEWKDLMVKELTEKIKDNANFYISDYTGLKADELNELRRQLEQSSSKYMVLKNAIAKISMKNAGFGELAKLVSGGTGIALADNDPVAIAKVLAKFSKAHSSLKIKGGFLDGAVVDVDRVKYLASLPSREELIAKVVYGIKAPISSFVGVLGNTLKGILYVIQAIKEKAGTEK